MSVMIRCCDNCRYEKCRNLHKEYAGKIFDFQPEVSPWKTSTDFCSKYKTTMKRRA